MMDKVKENIDKIVELFNDPAKLPEALAQIYLLPRVEGSPSAKWSLRNQILMYMADTWDARGYRQWGEVGRTVKPGAKCFYILGPRLVKDSDSDDTKLIGFKAIPVFRIQDTDGEFDLPVPAHLDTLPLIEVAKSWGIKVEVGKGTRGEGYYDPKNKLIGLNVKNLSTWTHELVHAAEDKLGVIGDIKDPEQYAFSEVVAEIGGCVLLRMMGYTEESDVGGAYKYVQGYSFKDINKYLDRIDKAIRFILATSQSEE